LRYFRTSWSVGESVHSGVYPPLMYSLYHSSHSLMGSFMSILSMTMMAVFSGVGTQNLGRS